MFVIKVFLIMNILLFILRFSSWSKMEYNTCVHIFLYIIKSYNYETDSDVHKMYLTSLNRNSSDY